VSAPTFEGCCPLDPGADNMKMAPTNVAASFSAPLMHHLNRAC
jgi:hypothetical protein